MNRDLESKVSTYRGFLTGARFKFSPVETALLFQAFYPKIDDAGERTVEMAIQSRKPIGPQSFSEEIGEDLKPFYDFARNSVPNVAAPVEDMMEVDPLLAAWNATYRANLMGAPLELKQLAFSQVIPRVEGGIARILEIRDDIASSFGESLGEQFYESVNLYELIAEEAERSVTADPKSNDYSKELEKFMKKIPPITEVNTAYRKLEEVRNNKEKKRKPLIGQQALDAYGIGAEWKAQLHRQYARDLRNRALDALKQDPPDMSSYALLAPALYAIEELRQVIQPDVALQKLRESGVLAKEISTVVEKSEEVYQKHRGESQGNAPSFTPNKYVEFIKDALLIQAVDTAKRFNDSYRVGDTVLRLRTQPFDEMVKRATSASDAAGFALDYLFKR